MAFVPAYILILGFTIVIDYIAGIYLESVQSKPAKRAILIISLVSNIGILAFFKYFNFFNHTVDSLLGIAHTHTPLPYITFLLPIGLSFHTFQAMSYTIEVYRGNHKAEKHFGIYALYVMFYPQLVAGPIERPQNILFQFHTKMKYNFSDMKAGLMQMAFGLFKKVVIADRLGEFVDQVYANPHSSNGKTMLIASILYSFQIYCDFSGYSDIGIGAARTMGFTLLKNFNTPYFATTIGKFWSRWHISLSTWFRDYLYIPLGGNRVTMLRNFFNIMVVFLISGLWHGARNTFIIWGGLHGFLLIAENVINRVLKKYQLTFPDNFVVNLFRTLFIFLLVTLAWIFFRSPNMHSALQFIKTITHFSIHDKIIYGQFHPLYLAFIFVLIAFLLLKEKYYLVIPTGNNKVFYFSFITIMLCCYFLGIYNSSQFIYFQF